jgi:hypothetical protein
MANQLQSQKTRVNKHFNETAKRSTRERLLILLDNEESMYAHWRDNVAHKINPTNQKNIERKFHKRISALKIVIYMLTPYFERDQDEPVFFHKTTKK